jgi:hypothetical protein
MDSSCRVDESFRVGKIWYYQGLSGLRGRSVFTQVGDKNESEDDFVI